MPYESNPKVSPDPCAIIAMLADICDDLETADGFADFDEIQGRLVECADLVVQLRDAAQ